MQALDALDAQSEENILLAGDMNWNDDKDGSPQLSPGWWVTSQLHPATHTPYQSRQPATWGTCICSCICARHLCVQKHSLCLPLCPSIKVGLVSTGSTIQDTSDEISGVCTGSEMHTHLKALCKIRCVAMFPGQARASGSADRVQEGCLGCAEAWRPRLHL